MRPLVFLATLVAVALVSPAAFTQTCPVLVDINTTPAPLSSTWDPGPFDSSAAPGGDVFFAGHTAATGTELWRTDGTAAGTSLVADIGVSTNSGSPISLTVLPNNSGFVFRGVNNKGNEPWVSDGTTAGTMILKDIFPFSGSSIGFPTRFMRLGNFLYFTAEDSNNGEGLWRTDCTPAGTLFGVDPNPLGTAGPYASDYAMLNNELYFSSYEPATGYEAWKTDGTPAGTMLVADSWPGNGSGQPTDYTAFQGEVYFFARTPTNFQYHLMATGTTPGSLRSVLLLPFKANGGEYPGDLQVFGNQLMFTLGDDVNGREWWVSDGTTAGTHLLINLDGTPSNSAGNTVHELASGFGVLFSVGVGTGREVFVTDGTAAGTTLVKDLQPAIGTLGSSPSELTALGNSLYFSATNGTTGPEPHRYVLGSSAATALMDINPGPFGSEAANFSAVTIGNDVRVFFTATHFSTGKELYVTDGTPTGTQLVKDIYPGMEGSEIEFISGVNGKAVFGAFEPVKGLELWVSDGTNAGTQLLLDIDPIGWGTPGLFVSLGDRLVFRASNQTSGLEPWVTDGTTAGTQLLKEISPTASSNPIVLTRVGDRVIFFARLSNSSTYGLYQTDGTTAGTTLISDLSNSQISVPGDTFPVVDGVVYFPTRLGATGKELWRSDLTAAGTYMLTDLSPGSASTEFGEFAATSSRLFFTADVSGSNVGEELYVSDGTPAGTHLVADLLPGPDGAQISQLTAVGERVYFSAYRGPLLGRELYVSDGVTASVVCDPSYGSTYLSTAVAASSNPMDLTAIGGKLVFSATDTGLFGSELWSLDDPGAHVVELGLGANGPFLELDAPVIGTSPELRMTGGITTGLNTVLLSSPLGNPLWGNGLMPSNLTWLNPSVLVFLAQTTSADLAFTFAIPTNPNLIGQRFNLQAASVDPGTLPGIALGNCVQVVLGL